VTKAADRRPIHAAVLELLERRHGIGCRGSVLPAWVELRLDRALDALAANADPGAAVELLRSDPVRLAEVADLLRIGETHFYRDPAQWDALRQVVLPEFSRRERVRALSVGCSSGEEAWTLAMLLDEARGRSPSSFRVVGIDRSLPALAAARDGLYAAESVRQLPPELAGRYLEEKPAGLRINQALRGAVSFIARDAMQGPPPGSYEIAICKNLFIYFGDDALKHVVASLLRSLSDGGLLLVARSEVPRVRALGHRTREIAPQIQAFCA
jgi:chemotaxis methyl-accepting protein methylase